MSRAAAARQTQGVDEQIVYTITTTAWGTSPTSPTFKVYDVRNDFTDVTGTVAPSGSPSISGDVVTLPKIQSLTENRLYRVELAFTSGGQRFETFFEIWAER